MLNPNVDIIVTTFKRNVCLEKLLESMPVDALRNTTVGDQNLPLERDDWRERYPISAVYPLPYDCGLSLARNVLIASTKRPFVLLMEDDFEWGPSTDVDKLLTLMGINEDVGVVGGMVQQNGHPINFEFIPTVKDGVLSHEKDGDHWKEYKGIPYKETGCIMNFALFRREVFNDIRWDPDLKLREHQDFYLRMQKKKWKVLYTPAVIITDAKPRHTPEYRSLKNRDEFMVQMMKKHGLKKIKYQNGSTRLLINDKIVKSREEPIV